MAAGMTHVHAYLNSKFIHMAARMTHVHAHVNSKLIHMAAVHASQLRSRRAYYNLNPLAATLRLGYRLTTFHVPYFNSQLNSRTVIVYYPLQCSRR